jgi:hypothetical protein
MHSALIICKQRPTPFVSSFLATVEGRNNKDQNLFSETSRLGTCVNVGPGGREFTNIYLQTGVNKIECVCGEISHCVAFNAAEITGRRLSDVIWLPFNELGKIALGRHSKLNLSGSWRRM